MTPYRPGSTIGCVLWSDRGHRWDITCSECLKALPSVTGTREDALKVIEAEHWELRDSTVTWCIECQRKFREVKPQVRRRRRR